MPRDPVIGVMGGASTSDAVLERAEHLGEAIADEGWVLLNGGRAAGVMAASARGAQASGGLVVGVLPGTEGSPGVAEDLDVAIFTDMGQARNVVNVHSSDVVVAMPGGSGTLSEAALAVKTGTPLVLLDWPDADVPGILADEATRTDTVAGTIQAARGMLEGAGRS